MIKHTEKLQEKGTTVYKLSGEKTKYSKDKVAASLRRVGTNENEIQYILNRLDEEIYDGITTKDIYKIALKILKSKSGFLASKYKLKKAIFELGPTGFPFEQFIGAILGHSGYQVDVGKILNGICVKHEVDVVAENEKERILIECKFHMEGRNSDVKIPLYIHSRFNDITNFYKQKNEGENYFTDGWVVTNTRFTADALQYAKCANLKLLSWDYPKGNGLKDRIDKLGLYPITVSTLLTKREKQFLLNRKVILCKELINDHFFLDQLEISESRKKKILEEMKQLYEGLNFKK